MPTNRHGSWAPLCAVACGGALALAVPPRPDLPGGAGPGPPRWVVADRDGQQLVLLDEELLVAGQLPVPWPTHVRGHPEGGLWVVSATEGHPKGDHLLHRIGPPGRGRPGLPIPAAVDLEVDSQGRALVLARTAEGDKVVLKARPDRIEQRIEVGPAALSLAPSGNRLGVAAGREGFVLLEQGGPRRLRPPTGPASCVLDAGALGGEAWVLLERFDLPGTERVLVIDANLRLLEQTPCPGAGRLSAADRPEGPTWVLGSEGSWARRVLPALPGGGGPSPFAALGALAAQVDARGGLLAAAPGAVLRLGPDGEAAPGQGGFVRLTDVAPLVTP